MNTSIDNLQTLTCDLLLKFGNNGQMVWKWTSIFFILLLLSLTLINFCRNHIDQGSKWKQWLRSYTFFSIVIVLMVLILRIPGNTRLELNPDESQWMAQAITLLEYPIYWKSVEGLRPITILPLTIIPWFGDTINYGSVKLMGTIFMAISALAIFLAFRNLFEDKIARVLVFPYIICISLMDYWDYVAYNSEIVVVVLLSLSIYFYSRLQTDTGSKYKLDLILLGFLLGCAPYTKMQSAPIAAVFGIYLVFTVKRKDLPYLISGSLVISILIFIHLLIFGLFEEFFLNFSKTMLYAKTGLYHRSLTIFQKFSTLPKLAFRVVDTYRYLYTQLAIIPLSLGILLLLRKKIKPLNFKLLILGFLLLVVTGYCIVQPSNHFTHYVLLLIVPLLFFSGILTGTLVQSLSTNIGYQKYLRLSVITLVLISGIFISAARIPTQTIVISKAGINKIRGINKSKVTRTLLKLAEPGDRLVIWGWANKYYVESGLPLGTRQATAKWVIRESRLRSVFTEIFLADMKKNKPAFFIEAVGSQHFGFKNRKTQSFLQFPKVKAVIDNHYQFYGTVSGIRIYVSKEKDLAHFNEGNNFLKKENLQKITLPEPSKELRKSIKLEENFQAFFINEGWAFMEKQNSVDKEILVILQSDSSRLIFHTDMVIRHELVSTFKSQKYLHAGFRFRVLKSKLPEGDYKLGIMIVDEINQKINGLAYTERQIIHRRTRLQGLVINELITDLRLLPEETNNVKSYIQLGATGVKPRRLVIENGWAFAEGIPSAGTKIFLVLKSNKGFYVLDTRRKKRPELANLYSPDYIDSGFKISILYKKFRKATYQVGLILAKDQDIVGFVELENRKIKID